MKVHQTVRLLHVVTRTLCHKSHDLYQILEPDTIYEERANAFQRADPLPLKLCPVTAWSGAVTASDSA
jgi:hypothetical protein